MKKNKDNTLRLHIDGRMLFSSGIGRCLREIIKESTVIDKNIKIFLYGSYLDYKKYLEEYSINNTEITFRGNNSPIYSLKEQVVGSWINLKDKSDDVFYYPHYNLPYAVHKNSIFTIHDFIQFRFPEYFGKNKVRIAKFILNNSVRKAKRIIVDSKSTLRDFYNYLPEFKEKVEVIYNGVSKKFRILEDGEKNKFLKNNKLGKYILFIGNNKPHKNISGLINSFQNIKKEFTDFKLVIISKGFDLGSVSIDNKIKDEIIVLNSVSENKLVYFYNCAYMLVLPSYYEGFGLPVIEAMACGCPVIASNVSSIPELCGDAAYLIDPYNNSIVTKGIIELIRNIDLRNHLIIKGCARAKLFNWEDTARKYISVFKRVSG